MLQNITIGQYFPGHSPLHRMDPRVKIVVTTLFITAVFLVSAPPLYLVLAAYLGYAAALSRISPKYLLRGLKPILFLVAFTFVLNVFFTPGGTEIWRWKMIALTREGLLSAFNLMLRLVFLVFGMSFLTLTTSPIALTDAIERLFGPLARLRVPVHELAMMMTIALRFIPTLLDETDRIMKAQMARGADFESGNILRRARALVPLLVPLFISAIRRADDLALAMEARCYHGGEGRTRMKVLKTGALDYAALALAVGVAVAVALPWFG